MRFTNPSIGSFADVQQNFEQLEGFLGFPAGRIAASGTLALTTTVQNVAGASLTVRAPGVFVVWGVFEVQATATGWNFVVAGLAKNGTTLPGLASWFDSGAANQGGTVAQNWVVSCQVGDVLQLVAKKNVNAGTVSINATDTTMTYLRIS